MFDGSARLMELADTRTEIQVDPVLVRCAPRATPIVDGVQVISGATVVVGDTGGPTAGEVCLRPAVSSPLDGRRASRAAPNRIVTSTTPDPATT